ncbi:hypothetical protein A2477_04600 [Candidatus Falkowbacteria bacterium RIFOXYC2_FULL_47_12]|uniref:Uncharacterized protein n=2 Tax=Candidatus Falkowiibacteriota TaxID=1752728 RepID=A0A1F5TLL5_9BACT|nr:MAG: hypothetical protein A2242_02275 [Candidatus Falkowbacteria bacterium RIFOXYA2_FULL_47_9]OGF39810.1 MAG: hypothetical protein A2477_04600 [Candidatus Falkowbacteria bacterium RIFOXYC2_FULL_47_12]
MKHFFQEINRAFNGFIVNLLIGGILLLVFAVLIVWVDFVLRLVIGCAFLIAAWIAFYAAYKLYYLKKHVQDFIPRIK